MVSGTGKLPKSHVSSSESLIQSIFLVYAKFILDVTTTKTGFWENTTTTFFFSYHEKSSHIILLMKM